MMEQLLTGGQSVPPWISTQKIGKKNKHPDTATGSKSEESYPPDYWSQGSNIWKIWRALW